MSIEERRKKTMENRSPWSSAGSTGSTSPLPVPANRFRLDKSGSGGSTCSLGSSPGTATPGGGSFSSLTVPEPSPAGKVTRSTSPFNFKARVRRRKEKKLEKQANIHVHEDSSSLPTTMLYKQNSLSPCPSFENVVPMNSTTTTTTTENGTKDKTSRLLDLRKKSRESSPFSLNFRRALKSSGHSDPQCPQSGLLTSRSRSGECESLSPGRGPSPENRSPRSPASPAGPCKCRRCSLLPLEECEPKEMNALFKFLRKSKVNLICFGALFETEM